MAARHVFILALGIAFSSFSILSSIARAQELAGEEPLPQVENAKHQFIGEITNNAVFVRSGPSNNFYPTMKLEKGDTVKVVGIKYDWLKIEPPKGSFSYVPQAFITRHGDGKQGRVNNSLNVRAGSALNAMKTTVQTKLDEGQTVTILGEQDEYFKIAPPEGAYLFVNQQHVRPLRRADQEAEQIVGKPEKPAPDQPATQEIEQAPNRPDEPESITRTPDPSDPEKAAGDSEKEPTTKPTLIHEELRKLEADFEAANKLPVTEQPIDELIARYTKLADSSGLAGRSKQIVDARLFGLKMRADARAKLEEFRKTQDKAEARLRDLTEEQKEIDARMKDTQVTLYTAVGTLRVSSLQQGNATLYRLTDPTTGRTVVYLRSNDPKYAGLLNQFVGVRGTLTNDERLRMKIITPDEAEVVDPSKVNGTIIATITPPGMLLPTSASVDQSEAGN